MLPKINSTAVAAYAKKDKELTYNMRGLSSSVQITTPNAALRFSFVNGELTDVADVTQGHLSTAAVEISGSSQFWQAALKGGVPKAGYESLSMGQLNGLKIDGDFLGVIAPYQLGLQRLFRVFVDAVTGPLGRKPEFHGHRDTDTAVGRYVYVRANGQEARMYYEEAGHGAIPLLLQATAGADSRQYRHLLADPDMQARFRMIAYDLPFHGRSLPPMGVRWWEQAYLPTGEELMNWVVALADKLNLDQPYFMGCSVGGQMALDLAAEHPDRFGAFISLNGQYDPPTVPDGFTNDLFRTPSISTHLAPGLNFGASSQIGPESSAHEVYWIYRSSFPGIYAGDNDYFMYGHDLSRNGHKIDAHKKPVYLIAGEYDPAAYDEKHGGAAVERNIPGVRFIVTPGLSHFTITDDPQGFKEALIPILDEVIQRTGQK
ncbi:alpha/beta fold hydrolase [Herbaspirillum seropedicae]|uniref:alpha/beta fold hydrolase n=1 Tax=Herbaspirillum seropedicae TaxID=964 RepID=UPI00285B8B24|nr:alpha/beta hydrolase [Herbaspirillum seropedicae]MDR6397516.1 pimeloyl-ACP methyl ester carboxylesterase [Herbaspirillum seropedicae]